MAIRRRETGLLVFGAAIVAASLLTETRRDVSAAAAIGGDAVRTSQNPRPRDYVAALDVDEWLARLKARGMNTKPSSPGLFGDTSWQPQTTGGAALPTKLQTPAFPFRMLGRMTLGGATIAVLTKGEQNFSAKVGEVLEKFRIDRIDEDGLRVTYLPNGVSRDYHPEDLYPAVAATDLMAPQAAMAQQPVVGVQPVQQQQAQAVSARPVAGGEGATAAGAAAASGGSSAPVNPTVQGAAAPIGGMVISPAQPGSGVEITPTPSGAGMVVIPTPPGGGMVITQPAPGAGMPGLSESQSGTNSAPAPK